MKTATVLQQKLFDVTQADKGARDFTKLYHQHNGLVRSVIYQVLGAQVTQQSLNDLVQDAFLKIWNGLPEFREEAQLKSWIYRISVNTALDSTRTSAFRKEVFDFDFQLLVDPRTTSDEDVANRNLVAKGLQELSEEHRVVVVLALIEEQTLEDIAQILEISVGTVKSRLHYAKEKFREILFKQGARP